MKKAMSVLCLLLGLAGCSSHTTTGHERVMEQTMGELDRETSR